MKKRIIVLATVLAMSASTIIGCGSTKEASEATTETSTSEESTAEAPEAAEPAETTEETEESVGMANPWVEITEEEAKDCCFRLFKAPEGATAQTWLKCEDLADPDVALGPMIQLSFTLDGMEYTARAQQGADMDADIAGNYVEWTVGPEETTLANWGEGNMIGQTYRAINDSGYVDMITWYDIEIGIAYSLTVSAEDLDGFDIQAIAEQMYSEENNTVE